MTRHLQRLATLIAFAILAAVPSFAADPAAPLVWIDACPGVDTGRAGIWLSLPNDDGSFRQQVEEQRAKAKMSGAAVQDPLDRSSDGLTLVIHEDGRKSINLQGRFQDALLARADADGSHQLLCTDSADQARQFTSGASESQPAPKPEEK